MKYWVADREKNKYKDYTYTDVPCRNADEGCEDTIRIRYQGEYKQLKTLLCRACKEHGAPGYRRQVGFNMFKGKGLKEQDGGCLNVNFDTASIVHVNVGGFKTYWG